MNLVTLTQNNNTNTTTMTSREIASVTGKRHDHVVVDIEKLNLDYQEMGLPKVGESLYTHEQNNQQYRQFILDKQQTLDLITGYSRPLRIEINRRWAELEEQVANPVVALPNFTNPAEAAIAWAEQYKAKEEAQLQVLALEAVTLEQAPKVEYCDKVLDQTDLKTVSDVASKQGLTAQELNKILEHLKVYDDRTGIKTFRSAFVSQGLGKMTTSKAGYTTAKLTIEGEYWVTTKAMKSDFAVALVAAKKAKLAKVKKPKY